MLKSMLQNLRDSRATELEGEGAGEAGFTLIELMVVLLIIAILLAIAIPTFLGVTGSANDRGAQSNLTNAVTEASAIYQNNNQAFPSTVAGYTASAPEFGWTLGICARTSTNCISFAFSTDFQAVILTSYSPASPGKCWYALVSPYESPTLAGANPFTGVAGSTVTLTAPAGANTYYDWANAPAGGCTASLVGAGWTHWSSTYGLAGATTGS